MIRAGLVIPLAIVAGVGSFAPVAFATPAQDFERGVDLYNQQDFPRAVDQFEDLLDGRISDLPASLVNESRKYLAAAYLFIGRRQAADEQFEQLLRAVPDYELDPGFPGEVQDLFRSVRDRMQQQRIQEEQERIRREREEQERREAGRRERRARIQELQQMAREVEVERRSSRVIATVPFGVGQFQNGDTGFGIFLAASEGVFFLGSVATLIAYFALPNDTTPPSADLPGLRRAERSLAILNWVSSGLFGTLAVIGIVDAHLRFEPVNRSTRERELPPELDELDDLIPEPEGEPTPAPTSAVRLELGLTSLRLRF